MVVPISGRAAHPAAGRLGETALSPYYLMRRYRHNDIRTTMQVYVTSNPLLDEAQHVAIVNSPLVNGNGNGNSTPEQQTRSMASDITMSEKEAMAKVKSLGINWRSLREYAVDEKTANKRNGKIFYSESFIKNLGSDWITKEEAMRLMGISSQTAFRNRVKNHGIGTLVIGRASLAKSADVIRSLRRGDA